MIKKLLQAAIVAVGSLALGGCPFEQAKTTAPAKPPAADYQAVVPPSPPATNIRGICYTPADLTTYRSRMLQQEFSVGTLQCQTADGSRAYNDKYAAFISKFKAELATNSRSLQQLGGRKRFNVDVVVTEMSNRMAQRAPVDREFCSRSLRALEWALDPKATSITLVPPPYDMGPEMNIIPCPAS